MTGIIIVWAGTLVSISSGWNLCDGNGNRPNLLGKYLKSVGTSEDPGSTGGASTHFHTSTATHNHIQDSHGHTGGQMGGTTGPSLAASGGAYPGNVHVHTFAVNANTATNQSATLTTAPSSNHPQYYKVAFIYDSWDSRYLTGSIILWNSAIPPFGWSVCNGDGDTPDLRDKFLLSVDSGENPGGTGGDVESHTHSSSHNHTQNSHTHTGSSTTSNGTCSDGTISGGYTSQHHSHSVSANDYTATNQAKSLTTSSPTTNPGPPYYKVHLIKNIGAPRRPLNGIVVWTGSIATIPSGYVLCDGTNSTPDLRNYFIRGAVTSGEIGSTGGSSNSHNHTVSDHTHTQDSHTHTLTVGAGGININILHSNQYLGCYANHTHAAGPGSATATNQNASVTLNPSTSEPPYYKVAFIMQNRELDIDGGALLMFL